MPLQLRRGTNAQRQSMTEPLAAGELIYVTDTGTIYVGNGTTVGGVPVINITATDIKPLAAQIFTDGSHTGISFTYNTGSQTIDAVVNPDLSNYQGVIAADAFQGSVFAEDSTQLVNAIDGSINLDGTVKGNIIPDQNEVYDIGSPSAKFGDLYLSGSSLYLGDAVITSTGVGINLPAGSTVGGEFISTAGLVSGSDYNINIVGDDSSIIVNSSTSTITASSIIGDLRGSVFGDDSSLMVDSVDKRFYTNSLSIEDSNIYVSGGNTTITIGGTDGSNANTLIFPDEEGSYMIDSRSLTGNILSVSKIGFASYKTSISSPGTPIAGEAVGAMIGRVYEPLSASLVTVGGFVISTDNNESIANDTVKGKMVIVVNGGTGTAPSLKYCTFDAQGRLAVNQQDAVATLDVNGFAKLAVLDTAPASPANGMIAIADGDNVSGWDPLGVPGKQQMVVYLGGGWRQVAVEP